MVKSEVSSNFAQSDSKWALIIISSYILSNFSQKVNQKWKMVKSEVGSNFAQNDFKWVIIVISSDILSQFSQKVDQKLTKSGKMPKVKYKQALKVQIKLHVSLRPTVFEIFTTAHQVSDNRGICSLIPRIAQIDI